jgi:hypothetical protein
MEYASSILSLMNRREGFAGHFEKALAGAGANPLLAKNLETLKQRSAPLLKYYEEKEKGAGKGKRG